MTLEHYPERALVCLHKTLTSSTLTQEMAFDPLANGGQDYSQQGVYLRGVSRSRLGC